jgi:hypothetical protein
MQFPDHIRNNPNFKSIVELAHSARAKHSARRHVAQHRVRLCEERLQRLRQELLDEDRNLKDVEDHIVAVRDLLLKAPTASQHGGSVPDINALYRHHVPDHSEDSSNESCSENSTHSN